MERISMKAVTLDQLVKHASKYGTEAVMETGIVAGFDFETLVKLQTEIDKIEKKASAGRRFSTYRQPRKTAEERVKKLLGIEEEEEGA